MGVYVVKSKWHGLDTAWMALGACADASNEVKAKFFADIERSGRARMDVVEAKAICLGCPVKDDCLDYAITSRMSGIWGGTTEKERKRQKAR